jgi:hypothetical protein
MVEKSVGRSTVNAINTRRKCKKAERAAKFLKAYNERKIITILRAQKEIPTLGEVRNFVKKKNVIQSVR